MNKQLGGCFAERLGGRTELWLHSRGRCAMSRALALKSRRPVSSAGFDPPVNRPLRVKRLSKAKPKRTTMENGTTIPPAAPPTGDRRLSTLVWEDRLKDYIEKRRAFLAALGTDYEADRIAAAVGSAEKALVVETTAPNPEALLVKLRIAFRGHADWHPRSDYMEAIGADVTHLFPREVAHGE